MTPIIDLALQQSASQLTEFDCTEFSQGTFSAKSLTVFDPVFGHFLISAVAPTITCELHLMCVGISKLTGCFSHHRNSQLSPHLMMMQTLTSPLTPQPAPSQRGQ
jgi:hypothetical protein